MTLIDDEFKLGIMLDCQHTEMLLGVASFTGKTPHELVCEAVATWYQLYQKAETAERNDDE